jgi:hypothetical protein
MFRLLKQGRLLQSGNQDTQQWGLHLQHTPPLHRAAALPSNGQSQGLFASFSAQALTATVITALADLITLQHLTVNTVTADQHTMSTQL